MLRFWKCNFFSATFRHHHAVREHSRKLASHHRNNDVEIWKMDWVTCYDGASGVLKHWMFRLPTLAWVVWGGVRTSEAFSIYICDTLILNFNLTTYSFHSMMRYATEFDNEISMMGDNSVTSMALAAVWYLLLVAFVDTKYDVVLAQ